MFQGHTPKLYVPSYAEFGDLFYSLSILGLRLSIFEVVSWRTTWTHPRIERPAFNTHCDHRVANRFWRASRWTERKTVL